MQRYRFLFLALLLLPFFISHQAVAQELTTFILVRHAEKADDDTDDPPLNNKGVDRARLLASMLKQANISAIYTTPYKRTRQTVTPVAREKGLDIKTYDPSNIDTVLSTLLKKHNGGTVVVSGHSNTTPKVANTLVGEQHFQQFDESDYGNIFIITVRKIGNGNVVHLRY